MSAMEMQRIPKFDCTNKAHKIRTQGQAATKMPQNYVPLRGKPKLFFSDEERERYEREKKEKREKTRINLHRLTLSRALLYCELVFSITLDVLLIYFQPRSPLFMLQLLFSSSSPFRLAHETVRCLVHMRTSLF